MKLDNDQSNMRYFEKWRELYVTLRVANLNEGLAQSERFRRLTRILFKRGFFNRTDIGKL